MTEPSLVVSEVFGPTVQGEGPSTGRRCSFVRLGACNLTCSWCDTAYTWDASRYDLRLEMERRTIPEIVKELDSHGTSMLVVSGGEPLLQQDKGLVDLLYALGGWRVEVETNGTIVPAVPMVQRVSCFNVSPKLAHSGVTSRKRIHPAALGAFSSLAHVGQACFKFVVTGVRDLDEVEDLVGQYDLDRSRCWVMPEGVTALAVDGHLVEVADEAIRRGFNLTHRLHVTIWNGERAR